MGNKLTPKVILEGTRLTFKTEIAFELNEHPRVVGPRKHRYPMRRTAASRIIQRIRRGSPQVQSLNWQCRCRLNYFLSAEHNFIWR